MAINFPHNPNVNDVHTEASIGRSWKWDGTTWKIYSSTTTGIAFGDLSVSQQAASGSGSLTYNNAGVFTYTPPAGGGGGGSSTFIGLNDTPNSLSAGKWLKVNTGGTALEWTDAPAGANTTYDLVASDGSVATEEKILLEGSDSSEDAVTLAVSGNLTIARSNNTITFGSGVPTTITVADESTDTECYPLFSKDATGDIAPKTGSNIKFNSSSGQLEAGSFKKTGGAAAEFLKADGSIDSNTYSQSNHTHSYALNDLSNVDATTNLANGKILKYDLGSTTWVVADDNASGGGSSSFTGLSDTPSAHSNNKWLKSDGSALIWADAPSGSNTTYDLAAAADSGNAKITLSGSDSTNDDVILSAGGGITYAVTGNTIQISSSNSLSGLTDVSLNGSPTNGQVLKYNGTAWVNGTDSSGGGADGNDYVTNLSLSGTTLTAEFSNTSLNQTIDLASINTDTNTQLSTEQVQDIVGAMFSGNTETNITATYQDSDGTIDLVSTDTNTQLTTEQVQDIVGAMFSGNTETRITATYQDSDGTIDLVVDDQSSDNNTTYDLAAGADSGNATITLSGSNSTSDVVSLSVGGGTSFSVTGNTIQISSIDALSSLSDVNISGSPANDSILQYNSSTSQWDITNGSGLGFSGAYADLTGKPTIPTNNNQLTNGAGYTTFDGAYSSLTGKPTIPTNNNQLTNGAGYITSSGTAATATNANNVKIRTDNGAAWHYLLFADSSSDNQNQTLKLDSSGAKYYPSLNWLQTATLQSAYMSDWSGSAGSAGQVLTSQGGSSQWSWTTPSSGGMTGQSKVTTYTSGNGTHTTQSWCKTVIAALVGAGGGGGNAGAFYDDDDSPTTGYGGGGGSGGVSFYTNNVSGATSISYSVGTGGSAQSSASCDDSAANGAAGTNTGFGGTTAGGGGGGQGVGQSGNGAGGAGGSGNLSGMAGGSGQDNNMRAVTPFFGKYGYGGRGADGSGLTGNDGKCNGGAESGENGAIIVLELG